MEPEEQPEPEPEPDSEETRTLGEIIAYPEEQDLPAVKRRLAQGADPNNHAEFEGAMAGVCPRPPLWWAASRGHDEVVHALADAGADIGWIDPDTGQIALHRAALNGHGDAVRSLASHGVQVDARSNRNWTPLQYAATMGYVAAVQALLEAGADSSLRYQYGDKTALHLAAEGGHTTVVQALLEAGADASLKTQNQLGCDTALDLAVCEGMHQVTGEIVRFLEPRGKRHCAALIASAFLAARYPEAEWTEALMQMSAETLHDLIASYIRGAIEARPLCGARQRLAFATGLLATAETETTGIGQLPFDVLPSVGEAAAALGPPAERVAIRGTEEAEAEQEEEREREL